jgi:hypothetical protein
VTVTHIANQISNPAPVSDSTLHVIGVVSNPVRWHSRYRLAREWMKTMEATPNVKLHVVEAAFGDRHHEVTATDCESHLQLRTKSEIWIKENEINLGEERLVPHDAKYIAWVDTDVAFRDPNWALETIHQLQHWPVVQPWQQCADLGPLGDVGALHQSFGYLLQSGKKFQRCPTDPYAYAHTGYAWACTREFWEQVRGLMDFCILGSADHHMAWAMIGDVAATIHGGLPASFFRLCREWQSRAMRITQGQVGFTPGRIEHSFHGSKAKRYYRERWQILIDNHFDPDRDLMYDAQGVLQLVGNPALEQAIRLYNRSRAEDSTEG